MGEPSSSLRNYIDVAVTVTSLTEVMIFYVAWVRRCFFPRDGRHGRHVKQGTGFMTQICEGGFPRHPLSFHSSVTVSEGSRESSSFQWVGV